MPKAHTLKERLQIGKQIKQALDAIVPENKRMTDKQIADALGCSQQHVTRIELLALYKLRQKLHELMGAESAKEAHGMQGCQPGSWHQVGGKWCRIT